MFVGAAQLRRQKKLVFLHRVVTCITFHSLIISSHLILGWALDWMPVHHRAIQDKFAYSLTPRRHLEFHSTNWRVSENWEETRQPEGNPHKYRENMQNSRAQDQSRDPAPVKCQHYLLGLHATPLNSETFFSASKIIS